MAFDPRNMPTSNLEEQDCIMTRKHDQAGLIYIFDSQASCHAYRSHVGLSDWGVDPITGEAWGRP